MFLCRFKVKVEKYKHQLHIQTLKSKTRRKQIQKTLWNWFLPTDSNLQLTWPPADGSICPVNRARLLRQKYSNVIKFILHNTSNESECPYKKKQPFSCFSQREKCLSFCVPVEWPSKHFCSSSHIISIIHLNQVEINKLHVLHKSSPPDALTVM